MLPARLKRRSNMCYNYAGFGISTGVGAFLTVSGDVPQTLSYFDRGGREEHGSICMKGGAVGGISF